MISVAIIKAIIIGEAIRQGLNPDIALAVAQVESKFKPNAIGRAGEIGLFQIKPQFSKVPEAQLMDPRCNAREGIRQLLYWQQQCGPRFLACFNGGKKKMHLHKYTQKVASLL
jgi:Transglycosylase SLT domain